MNDQENNKSNIFQLKESSRVRILSSIWCGMKQRCRYKSRKEDRKKVRSLCVFVVDEITKEINNQYEVIFLHV